MYLHFVYKNSIILKLLDIITLNFTMYILMILTCSLKIMLLENRHFET